VAVVIDFLVDVFTVRWKTADKDLKILLLRQQLRVLERRPGQRARTNRWEKCFLAVLLVQLKQVTGRSRAQLDKILIFKPQTILNGHGELVCRKGTFQHNRRVGRPFITMASDRARIKTGGIDTTCSSQILDYGHSKTQSEHSFSLNPKASFLQFIAFPQSVNFERLSNQFER
jgi:hypothetical protein